MKKKLLKYSACLMTALVLSAAGAGTSAALKHTEIVQAATQGIQLTQSGSSYTLTYGSNIAKNGYFSIPGDLKCGQITLRKGTYYFTSAGTLDLTSTSGALSTTVTELSSSGSVARTAAYVLTRNKPSSSGSVISSGVTYFTGRYSNKIYQNGQQLNSGYAYVDGTMYIVSKGAYTSTYTGVMNSSFINASNNTAANANGYYYENGKPATAVVNLKYYQAGVPSTYTGWKKMNSKGMYNGAQIYYFKNGQAVTGWQRLKSYGGGKTKYKYNFTSAGILRTNLFAWKRNYYLKQRLYIKTNLTTHTTTVYVFDKATKKYDIPAISAVCSTSRKKNGTKPVKKTYLVKTSARPWFIYKKSTPWHYYQYGVLINGSASWFHSTMYKTKKPNTLVNPTGKSGYNYLGTNQTTACIRHQAGMARLIYDMGKLNSKPKASLKKQQERIWVDIYRSSDKGPFGKITLKDSTGTLKKGTSKDPTDPKYGNSLFK